MSSALIGACSWLRSMILMRMFRLMRVYLIQLSDFGLAVTSGIQNKYIKLSGTLGYVAPEYLLDGMSNYFQRSYMLLIIVVWSLISHTSANYKLHCCFLLWFLYFSIIFSVIKYHVLAFFDELFVVLTSVTWNVMIFQQKSLFQLISEKENYKCLLLGRDSLAGA